jgi:DNA repair exonuclease SbcCD nuclease subunit
MLPWIESVNKITEVVESHVGKCQYIVCHADIRSAKFNKFQAEDKGMDPKVLKAFKRVYSGHIHLRQEIKKNGANVLYTGTPYAMDANDVDNQKGFDILSFVDGEIVEKFVPNTDSPIFVKKNLYTILEMSKDEIHSLIRNNFVNIQVDNRIVNRFSVQVFMELIKDMECRKIEFTPYSVTQKMDTKGIVQAATDSDIDLSIPNMMNLYLDQKGYDRAMRKKVESKFNEFLAKVKENQKTD